MGNTESTLAQVLGSSSSSATTSFDAIKKGQQLLERSTEVRQLLETTRLQDLKDLDSQQLVYADSSEDLRDCFHKLVEHKVHSLPVWDAQRNEWAGLLDWKDFANYTLRIIAPTDEKETAELLNQQNPVSLVDISQQNPYYPIYLDTPMLGVLSGFGKNGVHRRPVVTKEDPGKIVAMVSQSTVVKWLADNLNRMGPSIRNRTIESIIQQETSDSRVHKLKQVASVLMDTPMREVLKLLVLNDITGLGVLDHWGKLTANISVSDLQYMVEKDLNNLELSVDRFLLKVPRKPLLTCSPNASLAEVISKLAQEGVSRIYVVNEDGEPLAVISHTDVINAVLLMASYDNEEQPQHFTTATAPK